MKKTISLLAILILLMPISFSAYYADVVIDVSADGRTRITGETNHPLLDQIETQELTSKKGRYWLLNVTIPDMFEEYVYEVRLPRYSSVNYLKTPSLSRIEDDGSRMKIIGTASEKPFVVLIQYSIRDDKRFSWLIYPAVTFLLMAALLLLIHNRMMPKKKKRKIDVSMLSQRQKMIVGFLEKQKHPVTQKQIETALGLPKSSVSRNIRSLEQKGIIQKEDAGMSNLIRLK